MLQSALISDIVSNSLFVGFNWLQLNKRMQKLL